jgi:hypothetical protein
MRVFFLQEKEPTSEGAGLGLIAVELMLWTTGTMSAVVICGATGWRPF